MSGLLRVENKRWEHPVGSVECQPGISLAFCNGIMNEEQSAKESGEAISQRLDGQRVTVFHNPTNLTDYFDRSADQAQFQKIIVLRFARFICTEIKRHRANNIADRDIRVILFVHSHGAVVAKEALAKLPPNIRSTVEVFAFGGATMIPKNLAGKVHNYVREADFISSLGNVHGSSEVLNRALRVHKVMKEGLDLNQAIFKIAEESLYMDLSPILNTRAEDYEEKRKRFEKIFEKKNPQALARDPFFIEEVNTYCALFQNYNIEVIKDIPMTNPTYTPLKRHANLSEALSNLGWNLSAAFGNAAMGLGSAIEHIIQNHSFSNYLPQITEIAETLDT